MQRVEKLIVDVPDFPKPGIIFKDITPVLQNPDAFGEVIEVWRQRYSNVGVTQVVGIESRGFIFGAALARAMHTGFTVIRKPGKLPRATASVTYALEYGEDTVHMHEDALGSGDRVVIIDDLIATGGTAAAAASLAIQAGAQVHEITAMIELVGLGGRTRLAPHAVHSLLTY